MASIFRPWERRRQALVAAIGEASGNSTPPAKRRPLPFLPPAVVDQAAVRAELDQLIDALVPNSIDGTTGCVVDNLINARADEWIARLESAYAVYRAEAQSELAMLDAQLAAYEVLHNHDRWYEGEMNTAVATLTRRIVRDATPPEAAPGNEDGQVG